MIMYVVCERVRVGSSPPAFVTPSRNNNSLHQPYSRSGNDSKPMIVIISYYYYIQASIEKCTTRAGIVTWDISKDFIAPYQ